MKVNFWFWFRAFVMTCGFIGTVIAIKRLDRTSSPGQFVNLCPTRVTAVEFADQVSIQQDGLSWYRKVDGRLEEVDPIAVEKWFAQYCRVKVPAIGEPGETPAVPLATLAYVSGPPQILATTGEVLSFMGKTFESDTLKKGLSELREIPIRLRPSR